MNILKKILFLVTIVSILISVVSLYKIATTSAPDFSVYYASAQHLIHTQSLYTNITFTLFAYPPVTAFVFLPFVLFSLQVSQTLWLICSFIAAFLSVYVSYTLLKKPVSVIPICIVFGIFLFAFPTKFTFGMGQSNLVAYVLLLSAILLERKNKPIVAGIILALAIIFKPIFLFLLLYFLFQKSWRTILTCVISGIAFSATQFILFSHTLEDWMYYVRTVLPHLMTTHGREIYYNQGILGTISRFTSHALIRSVVATSLEVIVVIFGILKIRQKKNSNFQLAVLLCILPLIDGLSWQHHFIVLLFPFLFVWFEMKKIPLTIGLFISSYLLVAGNIKNPQLFLTFPQNLLLSHVFWGTLLLLFLLYMFTPTSKR